MILRLYAEQVTQHSLGQALQNTQPVPGYTQQLEIGQGTEYWSNSTIDDSDAFYLQKKYSACSMA